MVEVVVLFVLLIGVVDVIMFLDIEKRIRNVVGRFIFLYVVKKLGLLCFMEWVLMI